MFVVFDNKMFIFLQLHI